MPDREKVIEGLREMSCRCTWEDIDRIRDKFQPVVNGAIELLKEQETVIPKRMYHNERASFDNYLCECKNDLYYNQKFCDECGRTVKWNA